MYHLNKRGGSFEVKKKKKKKKKKKGKEHEPRNPNLVCSRRFIFAPQDISSSIHFRTSSPFFFPFFPQGLPGKLSFLSGQKKKTITPIIVRVTSSAVKE